jgi:S-adenosylmethionine:tRNA ribosyltransferase-isomerase
VKKSDLQFDLPEDLIAQEPCPQRDRCRLMVLDRSSRTIEHKIFADLPGLVRRGDLLVLNRSKVLPARFEARRRSDGRIAGLFVREVGMATWEVLLRGKGRLRVGDQLRLGDGQWVMNLLQQGERGLWCVQVLPAAPAGKILEEIGQAPLPPYIHRKDHDPRAGQDRDWYQTIYASEPGSVAAPTAGLHFTDQLLGRLVSCGVDVAAVTLHIGLGTFQPIEVEDLAAHKMHSEAYELPAETADKVNRTRAAGGRVIAVGTTSVRVLETCSAGGDRLMGRIGSTDIFIYPHYRFRCVDAMITNLHLPGSTLLALVFAMAGRDFVLEAYGEAVRQRYRFFSYGDAMIIL